MDSTQSLRTHLASSTGRFDAVVIGGGPAGTSAATLLAQRGRSVLLLERSRFPRFQIGESLIPETNHLLEEIGVAQKVQEAGFVAKRGAFFISPSGEHEVYIDFREGRDVSTLGTWQVSRDRFDQILLDHAIASGVQARNGCQVSDVRVGESSALVTWREGTQRTTVEADFVIDASGRSGFLAKRLGLRKLDPALANISLHSRFEGVVPPPGDRAGDLRVVSLGGEGWAWLIPLSESVTSVGVVFPRAERSNGTAEAELERLIQSSAALSHLVGKARRVAPVRIEADFSYSVDHFTGNRWMVVGDAGSFLDPIFSTGVLMALRSGIEAGRALDRALPSGNSSDRGVRKIKSAPLTHYERNQRQTYRFFRRFVISFYRPEFRDILLQPSPRFGVVRAVVTALAGKTDLVWSDRMRLRLFFALVAAQRRWTLVERIHSAGTFEASHRYRRPSP